MMFFWLPLLFLIPVLLLWPDRSTPAERVGGIAHAQNLGGSVPPSEDTNQILRRRLARGEITVAEFEEVRRLIGG